MKLIEKVKAFEDLYQRKYHYVYGYCKRNVTIRSEAPEDMAQEIFKNVFENMDSFRDESTLDTWLYACTRNFCLNRYRWKSATKRKGEIVDIEKAFFLSDNAAGALDQAVTNQILAEVKRYLNKMPLRYKEAISESMEGGRKAEIARDLGISTRQLINRLSKARAILRRHLKKKGLI